MDKISATLCTDVIPTQSVLAITSNVVYGKWQPVPSLGHQKGTPSHWCKPEERYRYPRHGRFHFLVAKLDYSLTHWTAPADQHHYPQGPGRTRDEQITNPVGILTQVFNSSTIAAPSTPPRH